MDMPLPGSPMVDMLLPAMVMLLPGSPTVDMLPPAMDMPLPEPTMVDTRLLTGGYAWWICLSQLEQQHHELDTPH